MTKKKQPKQPDRCPGSSQPPARRHALDSKFGWCDECGRWRRLIMPVDERVRLRSHCRAA